MGTEFEDKYQEIVETIKPEILKVLEDNKDNPDKVAEDIHILWKKANDLIPEEFKKYEIVLGIEEGKGLTMGYRER